MSKELSEKDRAIMDLLDEVEILAGELHNLGAKFVFVAMVGGQAWNIHNPSFEMWGAVDRVKFKSYLSDSGQDIIDSI